MLDEAHTGAGAPCRMGYIVPHGVRRSHVRTLVASCVLTLMLLEWSRWSIGAGVIVQKLDFAVPQRPVGTYSWQDGIWSNCSVPCGTGARMRIVSCVDQHGVAQPSSKCNSTAPATHEFCNFQVHLTRRHITCHTAPNLRCAIFATCRPVRPR
jgi:hypothetical protein